MQFTRIKTIRLAHPYSNPTMAVPRPIAGTRSSPSRMRIVLEAGKQQMILPDPIDAQVFARITLPPKAVFLQQPDRGDIGGDAGRFDAMQPQGPEGKGNDGCDRRGHVALARVA